MPPPDDKPRQSVANLIGRFEQQNKRSSPLAPLIPRQSTGGIPKDEANGKNDCPPKAVPSIDVNTSVKDASPPPISIEPPALSPEPPATVAAEPVTEVAAPPSPESVKSPPSSGRAKSRPSERPVHASPSHRTTSSNLKSKYPRQTSSLPFTPSPSLDPQPTGQSVVSAPSTTHLPRHTPQSTPATSRLKTPASSRPKTPGTSRPKTPATQPRRSNTPSTGLFAPTAASLARSRNAQPPLPTPIKKVTLSSSAAERLSKPTAASLSKARTSVPVPPSPARSAKLTATIPTPRGPKKLKVGIPIKKAVATEVVQQHCELPSAELVSNGHDHEKSVLSDDGAAADARNHHEVALAPSHDESISVSKTWEGPPSPPHRDRESQDDLRPTPNQTLTSLMYSGAFTMESGHEDEEGPTIRTPRPSRGTITTNDSCSAEMFSVQAIGHNIEDIVNLLERNTISEGRPQSIITIPDEHGDTSDEY